MKDPRIIKVIKIHPEENMNVTQQLFDGLLSSGGQIDLKYRCNNTNVGIGIDQYLRDEIDT